MYIKQNGAILTKDQGKFYILIDGSAYEVNEVGARIFDLCNGRNSKKDISEALLKIFDVEKEDLNKDIDEYLEIMLNYRVICFENS